MKNRDTQMLEEAYQDVLLNEFNWKGALAAGALALGELLARRMELILKAENLLR